MPLLQLRPDQIARILAEGGLLVDLRPIDEYLSNHWYGCIPLLYENGPGLGGRARDLLPLDARLALIDDGRSPLEDAAASFRGKGFDVAGYVSGDVSGVTGAEAVSTPDLSLSDARTHFLLDVADPGTTSEKSDLSIPSERLWQRAHQIGDRSRIGVLAGWGVRAAAAVGILEKLGFRDLAFVRTRPRGAVPPMAGDEVFRVGGTA